MKRPFIIAAIVLALLTFGQVHAQKHGLAAIDSMKLRLTGKQDPDTNDIKTIYRISDAYKNLNTDSAQRYTNLGFSLAKKKNWQKGIAGFYDGLGNLASDNGKYTEALNYYKASLKINRKLKHQRNEASNLANIGAVYQRQGNDTKALEYNFQALRIAERVGDERLIALLYANISNSYFSQQNYVLSQRYNFKAYKKYTDLKDVSGLARATNNIGIIYLDQKQYKEARIYLQKSLDLYKSIQHKMGEAILLSQMALLYENEKDKKMELMVKAQHIFDQENPQHANSITNIGNIGGTYADIYIHKQLDPRSKYKYLPDNYPVVAKKAGIFLNKAIDLSKQAGDEDNYSYFSGELAILQEKMGDYKNALNNYKISREISDSLYSQESKNKIAALEAQYAFSKKENEYRQQQQLANLKLKQVVLWAALLIMAVSAVLIYFLSRSRIGQLKLKNQLQRKEAEEKTRALMHINKLSESELKAIRAQMNPHFIFNVLNSIESYIVENDSKTASRLVQKFASLSRLILENSTQSLVSADREWKALKLYTELEAIRFNHQFSYDFISDPLIDMTALMLPPMLVQPLIENSIHHGMRNSTAAGNKIKVSLIQTAMQIRFIVEDNGIGMNEAGKLRTFSTIKGKSIGLAAIKERVEIFNVLNTQNPASFSIRDKTGEEGPGTIAELTLPKILRQDPQPAP